VLGLQGKFADAESVLRRDLSAQEAATNLAALRGMVAQPNSWKAIRRAQQPTRRAETPAQPNG
jgi:Flp pilus assembly protein TadD